MRVDCRWPSSSQSDIYNFATQSTSRPTPTCVVTLSLMNFAGYLRHVICLVGCILLPDAIYLVVALGVMVRVRIRFSVWLVSCYAHVFVQLFPLQLSHCLNRLSLHVACDAALITTDCARFSADAFWVAISAEY